MPPNTSVTRPRTRRATIEIARLKLFSFLAKEVYQYKIAQTFFLGGSHESSQQKFRVSLTSNRHHLRFDTRSMAFICRFSYLFDVGRNRNQFLEFRSKYPFRYLPYPDCLDNDLYNKIQRRLIALVPSGTSALSTISLFIYRCLNSV